MCGQTIKNEEEKPSSLIHYIQLEFFLSITVASKFSFE